MRLGKAEHAIGKGGLCVGRGDRLVVHVGQNDAKIKLGVLRQERTNKTAKAPRQHQRTH